MAANIKAYSTKPAPMPKERPKLHAGRQPSPEITYFIISMGGVLSWNERSITSIKILAIPQTAHHLRSKCMSIGSRKSEHPITLTASSHHRLACQIWSSTSNGMSGQWSRSLGDPAMPMGRGWSPETPPPRLPCQIRSLWVELCWYNTQGRKNLGALKLCPFGWQRGWSVKPQSYLMWVYMSNIVAVGRTVRT